MFVGSSEGFGVRLCGLGHLGLGEGRLLLQGMVRCRAGHKIWGSSRM